MKRFFILYLCSIVTLGIFTACQQDDEENSTYENGTAQVTLRIATADAPNVTRAWNDDNAETDRSEMMYNWTVLVVNSSSNQIAYKLSNQNVAEANAEIDEVTASMASGTYIVYSFANISEDSLKTILRVSSLNAGTTLTETAVANATVTIDANLKSKADIIADNAFGLGSKGIPMSNKQTLTVSGNTVDKDLIVVRMLAKLEFRFFNATGRAVHVKSITISDITKSVDGYIKLLPQYTTPANADDMEYHHQDLRPNLNTTATGFGREDVKYVFQNNGTHLILHNDATYDYDKLNDDNYAYKCSFYVNESTTPANDDHLFFLTLELGENDNHHDYRYALVTTGAKSGLPTDGNDVTSATPNNDVERWDYIARNDYRVIPVIIDDYKLEIIPYDFPAIGVYPASVKTLDESKNLYEVLFHDYGHFHLVPIVYKGESLDDENKTIIDYSATKGDHTSTVWSLMDAEGSLNDSQWQKVFKSYMDDATTVLDITANNELKFYGQPGVSGLPDDNSYPSSLPVYGKYFDAEVTHTKTIDEGSITYSQGDFPMLDTETKWDPKGGENYLPYIFGQIAPQKDNADKKTYHELRAYVYVNGESVPRQLVYRFYMHLKQDFGLARRYAAARPTCRLHCHE